ncbi:CDP-glycerol glycerophosphotransferase family protein [Ornithinibacillus salinisoli]|uniref:CDP-glycerol glycerophosphotransferase family protein n=1 Tax=Ornithinibacillus salinisoli TaxID=1848459 RepID=A0ABW4W0F1_9BACI
MKEKSCKYTFDPSINKIIPFDIKHPFAYLESIYHLATATTILVDNYQGFLAVTNFKKNSTCIQLWHAAGAIKQFGLNDPSTSTRSNRAKERFQQVYNRFHYTVVGSEKMATIFQQNFNLSNERIIRTGIPRTDVFFNTEKKLLANSNLNRHIPEINNKKIILYAPTFRENQLNNYQLKLNIEELCEEFSDEYVLFIRVHPAVSFTLPNKYRDFAYDMSGYFDINHLLLQSDILITDYSSIPFEYSLLRKPMIFFAYDVEEYRLTSGLMKDYENQMPGPIVFSTDEIIQTIKHNKYKLNDIQFFANQWNEYSRGNSSLNVARFIETREVEVREKVLL